LFGIFKFNARRSPYWLHESQIINRRIEKHLQRANITKQEHNRKELKYHDMGNLTETNYYDIPGVPQITTNFTKPNRYKTPQRRFADNAARRRKCAEFANRTTESLVNCYRTTLRYNLEGSHPDTHRHGNLTSYIIKDAYTYVLPQPPSFKIYSVNMIIYVIGSLI
jgi:hypothetical protein